MREVTEEKKLVKRVLCQLRSGSSPEKVRLLAETFHLLVHKHSKLVKEADKLAPSR